jgi:phage terminase large subunit-like protein
VAESLAFLPEPERERALKSLTEAQARELLWDWRFWARPDQQAPGGDWSTWLILAGRGWGKTRTGAEWIRQRCCGPTPLKAGQARWVAVVAETAADARDVMVEGESGILAVHPPDFRPHYEPSKRRLTWPNGAQATLYNATEPDQLRGPQHDTAWSDELAKWRYAQDTWDMLQFGLRLGSPRQVVTTTPRPIRIVRELLKDASCVVTRGRTLDNRANLAPQFLARIEDRYAGTRLGRQELNAEVLDDAPDALWTRAGLDEQRRKPGDVPSLRRVVVAIDPAAKTNEVQEEGAATGIVVAALGEDGRGYVLDDATIRASPNGWARRAVACFDRYDGDCIVGETNNGGEMVQSTVRSVRPNAPFKAVTASRGKWVRAEPIAALYEQGRVSHVGTFADLEDEMVVFGPNGLADGMSPDRVDALVWALTELFPQMTMRARKPGGLRVETGLGYDPNAWQRAH